jgi:hypothetical protein
MNYLDLLVLQLRTLVGDLDCDDYTYSDGRLKQLVLIAACRTLPQLSSDTYVIDMSAATITPEPSKELINMIALNAACLMTKSESKTAAGCSVKIIDGPSTIDLGAAYNATKEMSKDFCDQYNKEKMEYLLKNSEGYSSITPYGSGNHFRCCK